MEDHRGHSCCCGACTVINGTPGARSFQQQPLFYASFFPHQRVCGKLKGEPAGPLRATIEYHSPFEIPPASGILPVAPREEEPVPTNGETSAPLSDENIIVTPEPDVPANSAVVTETSAALSIDAIKKYHIIGGCFRSEENASGLVSEIQATGGEAFLIGTNASGLHMVSLFQSDDLQEVQAALPRMKQEKNPSVWIYTKK